MQAKQTPGALFPHPIVTRNRAGTQVLLGVRKTPCPSCAYGVRIETLWAGSGGEAHQISWCQSCFNAESEAVDLDDRERDACRTLVHNVQLQPTARTWTCARPAIADLEALGWL